jgi:hypothetical protein
LPDAVTVFDVGTGRMLNKTPNSGEVGLVTGPGTSLVGSWGQVLPSRSGFVVRIGTLNPERTTLVVHRRDGTQENWDLEPARPLPHVLLERIDDSLAFGHNGRVASRKPMVHCLDAPNGAARTSVEHRGRSFEADVVAGDVAALPGVDKAGLYRVRLHPRARPRPVIFAPGATFRSTCVGDRVELEAAWGPGEPARLTLGDQSGVGTLNVSLVRTEDLLVQLDPPSFALEAGAVRWKVTAHPQHVDVVAGDQGPVVQSPVFETLRYRGGLRIFGAPGEEVTIEPGYYTRRTRQLDARGEGYFSFSIIDDNESDEGDLGQEQLIIDVQWKNPYRRQQLRIAREDGIRLGIRHLRDASGCLVLDADVPPGFERPVLELVPAWKPWAGALRLTSLDPPPAGATGVTGSTTSVPPGVYVCAVVDAHELGRRARCAPGVVDIRAGDTPPPTDALERFLWDRPHPGPDGLLAPFRDRLEREAVPLDDLKTELADNGSMLERAEAAETDEARRQNADFREQLALLGVYQEFARPAVDAPTLEGLGLVEVVYPRLPPAPLGVGLSHGEWQDFLATVLDICRAQGAVARPPSDTPEDLKGRLPRFIGRPIVLSVPDAGEDEDTEAPVRRTIPLITTSPTARLLTYAGEVAKRAGTPGGGAQLLHEVWSALKEASNKTNWLRYSSDEKGYLIALPKLALRVRETPAFVESLSGRLFSRSVRGAAPVGARPSNDLRALSTDEVLAWRARNSVHRVLDDEVLGLSSKEHTAQIDVDELDSAERHFRQGRTNLLACSTTMEMGVDLGGLTLVVMTNVPPAASNYWQRAGRAGRRADGTSLALSLALQRPHDQKTFAAPQEFLAQPMVPPRVRFDLPALLLRHIYAYLLGEFFGDAVIATDFGNPMKAFGTSGDFFATPVGPDVVDAKALERAPDARCMADVFAAWLESLDAHAGVGTRLDELKRGTILAARTIGELGLLCRDAVMEVATGVQRDLAIVQEQRDAQSARGEAREDRTLLSALRYQERAIKNELLIAQLARSDVLPRFGFPLDVVRLDTRWRIRDDDSPPDPDREPALRMERDLRDHGGEHHAAAEHVEGDLSPY